ncbi:MAG: hypothetical protein ACK52I_14810 [Pseudomonadota bacterium]
MNAQENILLLSGQLYLTVQYLTDILGVSRNTYKAWIDRKQAHILPHPQFANRRIVRYDSIPVDTLRTLPTADDLLRLRADEAAEAAATATKQRQLGIAAEVHHAYHQGYHTYRQYYLPEVTRNITIADDLARCAAVFDVGLQLMRDTPRGYMPQLEAYTQAVQPLHMPYFRAANVHSVRQRIKKALGKDLTAWQEIKLTNAGNNNALKLTPEHQAFVLWLFAHETKTSNRKLDRKYVHELYASILRTHLPELGEPVDYTTVKRYLAKPAVHAITTRIRSGEKRFRELYDLYHRRLRPQHSLTLVAGDGLPVAESVVFDTPIRTTSGNLVREGQLTLWLWFDVHSMAVVSWWLGHGERAEAIRLSLRDIPRLHQGRTPRSVYMDKMWIERKGIADMLAAAAIHPQEKAPYNPQESPAENFNRQLNNHLRRVLKRYATITNHHDDYQHNPDFIRATAKHKRTETQLREDIETVIALYNKDKWHHLQNYDTKCRVLSTYEQLWAFGGERETIVNRGRFSITLESNKYEFEAADWLALLDLLGPTRKVRVRFDERHLKDADCEVSLWALDSPTYLGMAHKAGMYHMATVEQTSQDKRELHRQATKRKAFNQQLSERAEEVTAFADSVDLLALMTETEQLKAKEARALMVDNGYGPEQSHTVATRHQQHNDHISALTPDELERRKYERYKAKTPKPQY